MGLFRLIVLVSQSNIARINDHPKLQWTNFRIKINFPSIVNLRVKSYRTKKHPIWKTWVIFLLIMILWLLFRFKVFFYSARLIDSSRTINWKYLISHKDIEICQRVSIRIIYFDILLLTVWGFSPRELWKLIVKSNNKKKEIFKSKSTSTRLYNKCDAWLVERKAVRPSNHVSFHDALPDSV